MSEPNNPTNDVNKESKKEEQDLIGCEHGEELVLEHPSYKQLEDKLTAAEQQSQEYWNSLLRAKAEIENIQRRSEREISNAHKYALEKFIFELLAVVDNIERSLVIKPADNAQLKDFYNGIELTLKLFLDILQKFGVTQIYPMGEMFDPNQHTAIKIKDDQNAKSNIILEVVQKGYWLRDRLLRPASVIVAK